MIGTIPAALWALMLGVAPPIGLSVEAPATLGCPPVDDLRAQVRATLGRDPFDEAAARRMTVVVRTEGRGLRADLRLREALMKYGRPRAYYVDRGAAYRAASLRAICAELGIDTTYTEPRDAAACPARGARRGLPGPRCCPARGAARPEVPGRSGGLPAGSAGPRSCSASRRINTPVKPAPYPQVSR